ncbi:MAG: hypothetical protein VX453_12700 [Acidobacteriota bacterium]|nr:hypothetical protein [Acidobacteriota bacterium]
MSLRSERTIQDEQGTRPRATRFYETQVEDHLTSSMQDFIRRQQMVFVAVQMLLVLVTVHRGLVARGW